MPETGHRKLKNFFFEFSKNKSDKMCHMGACMERSLWDVKALFQEILLRQKKFKILKKNKFYPKFGKKIWNFPENLPFSAIH